METIDILREQIKELEKLLELKNRRISELEGRNNSITITNPQPYIYNPCTCGSSAGCPRHTYGNGTVIISSGNVTGQVSTNDPYVGPY